MSLDWKSRTRNAAFRSDVGWGSSTLHLQAGSAPGFSRMQISVPFSTWERCVCQFNLRAVITYWDSELLEEPRDHPVYRLYDLCALPLLPEVSPAVLSGSQLSFLCPCAEKTKSFLKAYTCFSSTIYHWSNLLTRTSTIYLIKACYLGSLFFGGRVGQKKEEF